MFGTNKKKKETPADAPVPVKERKRGKKEHYPTKQTLNLLVRRKTLAHPTRLIPALLAIVLVAGVIGKFAVMDRLAAVEAEQLELDRTRAQIAALQARCADYEDIEREYNR